MKKRVRKTRPQMKRFLDLRRLLPDYTQAEPAPHFLERADERGFNVDLIPVMWRQDHWSPTEMNRWNIEYPVHEMNILWSLTVAFADEDDRPTLVTIVDRSLECHSPRLPGLTTGYATGGA